MTGGGTLLPWSCDQHLEEEHDAKRSGRARHVAKLWFLRMRGGDLGVSAWGSRVMSMSHCRQESLGSRSDEAKDNPTKAERQALFCCLAWFLASHGGFPRARCDPASFGTLLRFFVLLHFCLFFLRLPLTFLQHSNDRGDGYEAQHRIETLSVEESVEEKGSGPVHEISAAVTQTSGKKTFIWRPVSWCTSDYKFFSFL